MDLVPAAVAERLIGLSRREGLWRGRCEGVGVGVLVALVVVVVILRGIV